MGVKMRINRNMVLKIANDTVDKYIGTDRTILAIYLQGSLLGDSPLIGNTADIDLFLVHTDEVDVAREIIRVSDEVHLDISHHSHAVYRQPRELRLHPWLGPAIYNCKIMYDPQHFLDFVQASVRGQFYSPDNVLRRARKMANHAREIWQSFYNSPQAPGPQEASIYLRALEHAANAIAGLSGRILSERRFLMDFPIWAQAVNKPGLSAGFLGLLGVQALDVQDMRAWMPEWQAAYADLPANDAPIRLHPYRWLYYERAVDAFLSSPEPVTALWPLWRTWTHAIYALPADSPHQQPWQQAGERLGLLGPAFTEKISGLDAYLDTVDELMDAWGREKGG
jgi:hypothetical protein